MFNTFQCNTVHQVAVLIVFLLMCVSCIAGKNDTDSTTIKKLTHAYLGYDLEIPEDKLLTLYVVTGLAIATTLVSKRVREAHDLHHHNTGFFRESSLFYRLLPQSLQWFNALPFLLNYLPTVSVFVGIYLGGHFTWLTFFAGYVVVPLLDLIVGEDSYNPTKEEEKELKANVWFRVVTWFYPPSYIISVLYGAYYIGNHPELTNLEIAGISVSVSVAGGFGIGCIHELVHRPSFFELNLARISLVFSNYGHFWIEHIFGHHKRVATDADPASSAVGDNIYTFLIRCWYGVLISAWDIEKRILAKKGYGPWNLLENRIIQAWSASTIVTFLIYNYFGFAATVFYIAQGVGVAAHIDNANYIEHYGLRRRHTGKLDKDGELEYERPGWFHAWNTADRISNYLLFKIERHPDHHCNAGRPYQILRHFKESPTMPTGYAGMFVLSWFPPLWFMIMDPLVKNAYQEFEKYEKEKDKRNYEFPRGVNNMSSVFKREGEGFFEEGSSPYDKEFYGKDSEKTKQVWNDKFTAVIKTQKGE